MTTATATAEAFGATKDSVLSPVLIGLHVDRDPAQLLAVAWHAATQSIPVTTPKLNLLVKEGRRTVAKAFVHTRALQSGSSDRYQEIVRLCDGYKGQSSDERWKRWRWSVGGRVVTDKQLAKLLPAAKAILRLDVLKFRITGGIIDNAAELALFRHYVVSGLQAIDPAADVTGGQHDWENQWWRTQPPPATA